MTHAPTKAQRLKAQLAAFLEPIARASGQTLREISGGTINQMAFAGIVIGTPEYAALSPAMKQAQMMSVLVLLTADPAALKTALREADGNFDAFYWNFAYDELEKLSLEVIEEGEAAIQAEMPAIEAGQVEAQPQNPDTTPGKPEPPNT